MCVQYKISYIYLIKTNILFLYMHPYLIKYYTTSITLITCALDQSFQKLVFWVSWILRNIFKKHQDWGTFWTYSRIFDTFCCILKKRNKQFPDKFYFYISVPHLTCSLFPHLKYFLIILIPKPFFFNLTQCK